MNFIIQIIVGVVLSLASTLLQQAFAPKTDPNANGGTRGSTQIGGKVPQYFLMGTVGDAGKLEYRNAWGNAGQVPNAYLTSVQSFGDLPISAMVGMFVNGVRREIPAAGAVAQGYPVAINDDGGVAHLWRKFFDGTQTVADSYLVAKFGSDADRAWASDMVGRGVPYLITTALWNDKLWTGFPTIVGEFQGIKLYDPRKDSTAGGSGTQRWADQSTWAFSDNSAVMIYNIERGIYYSGAHIWGGNKTAAEMPYAVWAAAMDKCDVAISLIGGGTEKQFRAGRKISLNERPADVIKELLIGANARISHASDGTVYILVGVPSVADSAFSDADVLATEALGSIPFPNLDEVINGVAATYREPTQAWEDKETAPYYRSDLVAEDDGRENQQGLDLGTTFSGTQAQRVLQATLEEGRRFRRHVVALPPEFAQFRPLQVLAWTTTRFGYTAKLFLITARTRTPSGNVVLGLQEIDPSDHNWVPGTDQRPLSFAPVVTNRPAPQEVSGFYVEPAIALDSLGRPRRPAIDVFWASASVTVDVRAVRITVRTNLAVDPDADDPVLGPVVWEGEAPRPVEGSARLTEGLVPDCNYLVQIQYVPFSGRVTVESTWLPVTTPNILLGGLDIYPINLAQLDADIAAWQFDVGNSVRDTREAVQRINLLVGNFSSRDRFDKQTLRKDLVAAIDGNTAKWSYEVNVLAAADAVAGSRIEAVELTLPTLATLAITDILSGSISTTNGNVTALGVRVTSIESALPGLATVSALSALTTTVTTQGGSIAVNAAALTALEGVVGYASGSATFRMGLGYTPSAGWTSAGGLQFSVPGGTSRPVGIYFEATASSARSVWEGDQMVIRAGGVVAAMFETGTTYIANARIHNLTATNIDVANLFAQNAAIAGVLTVGSYIKIDGPTGRILVTD